MKNAIRATTALAAAGLLALAAGCDRQAHTSASAKPVEQTVNVPAAPPTGDPPGTTPVDGKQTAISKQEESTQKPQEGDDHAYSTVSPDTPQKAGGSDPLQKPERAPQ